MTTDPPCPRRDKWFRGCRFEPRYDVPTLKMPSMEAFDAFLYGDRVAALGALRGEVYVHDLCTRCGKVVDRGGAR
ncbi:hypothetical protein LPC10_17360 [Methylorubrum sp. B1-46]|jgi:hypothetical protein|uniref:hypothetical protein n=1 Tax=Methylorubrum sp. B1-46 TaxID=2897334 RepID=UPI001E3DD0B6|nr:hypothetical protein [Methylorubrum sp. B1-46]UGB24704.1 hypothetical protein LPC10_17360 [Methylorubrum sp. B1-46]